VSPGGGGEGWGREGKGGASARQKMEGAVPHAAFVAANERLRTLADAELLAREGTLGLTYEALLCILSRRIETHVKATIGGHRKPEMVQQYVRRYLRGESLLEIAKSVSLPPTMLARVLLEGHLGVKRGRETGQLLRQPQLLEDERLQHEVAAAVEADPFCGPHVDTVRRIAGLEYEELLAQKLRALDVPFMTEDELRLRGDAKTPDALLPVPLLVRGRVVNWIDSKATFGDPSTHAEYRTQFASYLHRFDAGLVIYWFGFDESIDTDPRILLLNDLSPGECTLMTCLAERAGPVAATGALDEPFSPGANSPAVARWTLELGVDGGKEGNVRMKATVAADLGRRGEL
jgi:hypothetical protein